MDNLFSQITVVLVIGIICILVFKLAAGTDSDQSSSKKKVGKKWGCVEFVGNQTFETQLMPVFIAEWKDRHGRKCNASIPGDRRLFVGHNKDCDLMLDSKYVTDVHAELYCDGTVLKVHDLESTNGTYVGKQRITDEVAIKDGQTVRFGDREILFKSTRLSLVGSKTMDTKLYKRE